MMVTVTIDRTPYTVGPAVTVGELYRRARLDPATRQLVVELRGHSGPPPALDNLDTLIRFTGARRCAYREFVSQPR